MKLRRRFLDGWSRGVKALSIIEVTATESLTHPAKEANFVLILFGLTMFDL